MEVLHYIAENKTKSRTANASAGIFSMFGIFVLCAEVEETVLNPFEFASNPSPLAFSFVQAPQKRHIICFPWVGRRERDSNVWCR